MSPIKSSFLLGVLFLLVACGQTPKEKQNSQQQQIDSLKTAKEQMLKAEEKAASRLDSIRNANKPQ